MLRRLRFLGLALALVAAGSATAETVTVEGMAPIRGDIQAAREEAIRHALAEAARRAGMTVSATSGTRGGELAFDQTVVRASAVVQRHRILAEAQVDGLYKVTISADIGSTSARGDGAACRDNHVKRILIGGFPLLRPEEVQAGELGGYARLTAVELARRFGDKPAVLVDHDGGLMVHFAAPERVVGDAPADALALSLIRSAAEKHRAQYVLVGRFLSMGLGNSRWERTLDVEALLLDAMHGTCVARQRFTRVATGSLVVPAAVAFGSAKHYATDYGRLYSETLDDIARWAETEASCKPFSARVLKVEKNAVYFDAGAEQRISIGDTFSAFRPKGEAVTTRGGEILGAEQRPMGDVRVTNVYPRFAIGELLSPLSRGGPAPTLAPGDVLYSR